MAILRSGPGLGDSPGHVPGHPAPVGLRGARFATLAEADAVVAALDATVGPLDRLRCLHFNDSKVPLGANRDRHENLGQGTIGTTALDRLLGHPALQRLPAIMEVPGDGSGPASRVTWPWLAGSWPTGRRRRRIAGTATQAGSVGASVSPVTCARPPSQQPPLAQRRAGRQGPAPDT